MRTDKSLDIKDFKVEDFIEYISPSMQQKFYVKESDVIEGFEYKVGGNGWNSPRTISYYDKKGRFRGYAQANHFLKAEGLRPTIIENAEVFI